MRLIRAARFAGLAVILALALGSTVLQPGLAVTESWELRQAWLQRHGVRWVGGGWLGLVAVFAWMVFLVALMYNYVPAHRISTHLQMGLMLMGALLLVVGILVWMGVLPAVEDGHTVLLIDRLALTLMGGGLFMAGTVTAWIALDLGRLQKLPWRWVWPGILAGLATVPSPFLLPGGVHLAVALVLWIVWCGVFAFRRDLPSPFPEYRAEPGR